MIIDRKKLFDGLRKSLFGGRITKVQVDSVNGIIDEWYKHRVSLRCLAYMISTGWHEAQLRPVREGFKKTDKDARAYVKRKGYPYAKVINGFVYYGRGLVQLTWQHNYQKWGIERTPNKALEPAFAAKVLVVGMLDGRYNGKGKGLAYYLDKTPSDWKNARRTVNITDRWQRFMKTAQMIERVLEDSMVNVAEPPETKPKPAPKPKPKPKPPAPKPVPKPQPKKKDRFPLVMALLAAAIGAVVAILWGSSPTP